MSQKQKSILSFFKQAEPSNSSNKPCTNIDTKKAIVKKEVKIEVNVDSESVSPKSDSNIQKKVEKTLNGKDSKKSSTENKADKSVSKELNDESPVKQIKKRKRATILDSDDDSHSSDELPNKKHMSNEDEGTNGNHHNDSNGNGVEETSSEMDSDAANCNSRLSKNGIQDEPMDEDQSVEDVSETNKTELSNTKDKSISEASSASQEESVPEFIPKRKTARKQMRGGQLKKDVSKKNSTNSAEPSEPNSENTPNDTLQSEELSTEKSEKNSDESNSVSSSDNKSKKTEVKKESPEKEHVSDVKVETCEQEDENEKKSPKAVKSTNANKKQRKSRESKAKVIKKEAKSPKEDKEIASDIKKEPQSDSEEDTKEEVKSPKADTGSNSNKKAIHPFFAKNKNEEVPSKDSSTEKKTAKPSTSTGMVYDPSKNHYHPIDDACWKQNEKVPYLALAKTLELIENISGRLKIVEILANYFRSVIVLTPEDLLQSVYLCLNRLAPEYEGIELGIGELLLMKALAQATGRTTEKIKAEVAIKGDLGLVAESSRGNQRLMFAPPKLTVATVFSKFKEIAKMSGNSAMAKKTDKIQALFVACRECEAKYIIRSLSGKLRIGLAEQSVLAALARAAVLTPPNQSFPPEIMDKSSKMSAESFKEYLNAQTLILKTTYCECPNYDLVIPVLLKEGIAGLPEHCQLTAGFPLKPMLAHPTNGIEEVLNRFDKNEFTCEFKYDGERAQIHMTEKGEIKIYSRNQEDNTSKYPDVISRLSKTLKETTKSFILDSEAVAWDSQTKQILTFQVLSTRKKKDAVESDIVVQVCIMAFDLIYLNGESLVKKPLKERRDLLHSAFIEVENEFMFATYKDGNSAETMQEFLDESIKGNCEGLMVKSLTVDASYEIAKRSHNWLKLKKDYLAGIGDTLDLMVIGGYHGKGKRAGTFGGFLLACYDDENEEFQSICKLGTGFSDTDLETHTKFFKEHVIEQPRSYYRYDSSLEPDVWFDAVQIWEIKCADLSISPIHKAAIGIVDPEKGISLRFPRFLRIRDDKSKPEDATVSSEIANMYQKQDQVQNSKKSTKTEEDYY